MASVALFAAEVAEPGPPLSPGGILHHLSRGISVVVTRQRVHGIGLNLNLAYAQKPPPSLWQGHFSHWYKAESPCYAAEYGVPLSPGGRLHHIGRAYQCLIFLGIGLNMVLPWALYHPGRGILLVDTSHRALWDR